MTCFICKKRGMAVEHSSGKDHRVYCDIHNPWGRPRADIGSLLEKYSKVLERLAKHETRDTGTPQ